MTPEMQARIVARRRRRQFEARMMQGVMLTTLIIVVLALVLIMGVVVFKGLPTISWEMLTQPPKGGSALGVKGGIANSIVGSIYLALGGTALAFIISLPVALYLNTYANKAKSWVRLVMDVLWGVPSLLYGAVAFSLMLFLGVRASLLLGIITLALVELPLMARTMDEVLRLVPRDLHHNTLALGATRFELMRILVRQTVPGLLTAVLLAFGRGIGDAAAVLFTAGYTDRMPGSLFDPTASLPLTVFFQLGSPFPSAQARAYAAALILMILLLLTSGIGRFMRSRLSTHIIR